MKSVFLLSESADIFVQARDMLVRDGASYSPHSGGVVQLRDEEGRLLTVYGSVDADSEWEFREGPFTVAGGATLPVMTDVTACVIECRFEDLVATTAARLADELSCRAWILDGDGVLWLASEVDPVKIRM